MNLERVHIIGAGAWGTALAQAAAIAGRRVTLAARTAARAHEINTDHTNTACLGNAPLHPGITGCTGYRGLAGADLVLIAVPAQSTRIALRAIGGGALAGKPVILCAKGLEAGTLASQSGILAAEAPGAFPLVLSGPSFAADVMAGRPTAVTLASNDPDLTARAAAALSGPGLRPYAAADLAGVELAGALKNVYALACGAVEGAGLGLSARSALLARAFAELQRLVTAMGGEAQTLTGLAGLGDLALSCTSKLSRNYHFGVLLGRGQSAAAIQAQGHTLAEGVKTAPVARQLAARFGIDAPLIGAVNQLLDGDVSIDEIVAGLLARPLKREGEG